MKKNEGNMNQSKKTIKKIKGFTLIELLAVIIILGILMIIAIPSVTKYINDSRKSSYISTAKEIIVGARNLVNDGKLEMFDTNSTYYIPTSCIKTENASKSPYGDFTQAYIGVTYDGKGYKYYWISVDDAGQGVANITPFEKLDEDYIESDLKTDDIKYIVEHKGIGQRTDIKILDCDTNKWKNIHLNSANNNVSEINGGGQTPSNIVCIPASELHSVTCDKTNSNGCNSEGNIGTGNIITYGSLVNGTPKPGDAYDCKLTKNSGYTERFYYLYSSGNNTILIYSKNINDQVTYQYDSNNENIYGPRSGFQYLPSTSDWDNPGIIAPSRPRNIVNQNGGTSTSAGNIESFTYTGKAARFLTYQELKAACGITDTMSAGSLADCNWFLENLGMYESETGAWGYWLETPTSFSTINVWLVSTLEVNLVTNSPNTTSFYGVRPVITISTEDLG